MRFAATLFLTLLGSALMSEAVGPVGFQVLGTTVPKDAESTPIPEGWIEQQPEGINTTMPEVTDEEQARGYVTFSKNYLEMVYPGTCPTRDEVSDTLEISSASDAFEIATLSVRALRDLENVQVTASDLTSEFLAIDAENIEVRSVRCMPNRIWAKNEYIVTPTLLELRDQLNIAKDTTQRFWITVYVPPETPAGDYNGSITIRPQNGTTQTLAIRLSVVPVRLRTPPVRQGMYANLVILQRDMPNMKALPEDQLHRQLLDMKVHGMDTIFISFGPTLTSTKDATGIHFDMSLVEPFARLCQQVGITHVIWNFWTDEFLPDYNPHNEAFGTMVKAFVDDWRARGWPKLIASAGDEADANGTLEKCMKAFKEIRHAVPDIEIFTTVVFPENSEVFEPLADIRGFSSYADETITVNTQNAKRNCWMYSGTSEYGRNGIGDRLYRGIWAAKLELEGVLDWTYWRPSLDYEQPFNDLVDNGSVRPNFSCWVFPTGTGPLPTTGWESIREGIEDLKYIYTLQQLIKERRETNGTDDKLATEAEAVLQKLFDQVDTSVRPRKPDGSMDNSKFTINIAKDKLTPAFFIELRDILAEHIMKLQ
jgi:hypothetical protein